MNIKSSQRPAPAPQSPAPKSPPQSDCECPPQQPRDSFLDKAGNALMTGVQFTLNEGVMAAQNDPALAMRLSATMLSDQILKKVNQPVQAGFQKNIVPVMRLGLLGMNTYRAHRTLKNPNSTKLDKAIDIGVVASDLVGAVGGLAVLTGSQFSGLGETMMGFSYAVDVLSHAYRGLTHGAQRYNVWTDSGSQEQKKD